MTLFSASLFATLTIGLREARADYLYEVVVFALAAWGCVTFRKTLMPPVPGISLALLFAWGFLQLAVGATVYRYGTLQAALRFGALAATAWIGFHIFRTSRLRTPFLRAFAWTGALIAVASVLGYLTSPGKILWIIDAPYPDIWGPFLSRNNFAQFLELAMPVALWFGLREPRGNIVYIALGGIMLGSGLASASRSGSAVLVLEAIAVLWIRRRFPLARRMGAGLVLCTIAFAAMPGVGNLAERLTAADPYQGRREIAQSTLAMISSRPWTGFGLGTFSAVYPAYAVLTTGQSVEHAHNDWLEWTAEGGVPYTAVWIALALWCVGPAVRSGWGIGVLGCFLHGVVDYPFARLGVSSWIFVLVGMLAAKASESPPPGKAA